MLNGTERAEMSRPPIPYRGDNYQGYFELTAGQELEMSADGQDGYKTECPEGKVMLVTIRLNIQTTDA